MRAAVHALHIARSTSIFTTKKAKGEIEPVTSSTTHPPTATCVTPVRTSLPHTARLIRDMCVCVLAFWFWPSQTLFRLFRCFLLRPSTLAVWCLDVISGGLPRRLDFSYVCDALVPFAPTVGAVRPYLCLVHWWHRMRCDVCVVSWFKLMGPIGIVLSARHKHWCAG